MNTTSTTAPATYYEVAWGCDEHDRTVRVDRGDGAPTSVGADLRAAKVFHDMEVAGVPVALYVNGVLMAGVAHSCEACIPAQVVHRTKTWLDGGPHNVLNMRRGRYVPSQTSWWSCTCGDIGFGETREIARRAARSHREYAS